MHLVQKITARTSTKHNEAQHASLQINTTNTQRRHISPHRTVTTSTKWWEQVHFWHDRRTTAFNFYLQQLTTTQTHNNFPEGLQNNTYTQSLILCQIQNRQLLTENQIPQETFMTPSDKLFHIIHWVKQNEGQLSCYLKITHYTEASWTLHYIHFLFRESPGYFYIHYHMLWSGKVPASATGLAGWPPDKPPDLYQPTQPGWPMTDRFMAGGVGLGLGDGFGLFVHLQSISERVLSALACLFVERMVCLTAERGWNKEWKRQRFKDKEMVLTGGAALDKTSG